jgi:hypothetical protein
MRAFNLRWEAVVSEHDRADGAEGRDAVRWRMDRSVNLTHVLTAVLVVSAGFTGWSVLQERVSKLEVRMDANDSRNIAQDHELRDKMSEIRSDIREIRVNVQTLAEIKRNGAR